MGEKNKEEQYRDICLQLRGLTEKVPHFIANLANTSALLNELLEDINWVGFYLIKNDKLVLGPFQGRTACIEIAIGRGVCGTAVMRDEVMLVEDVHTFKGHIACDSASRSEIVIPLHADGMIVGVLDIDSPLVSRFDEQDAEGLAEVAKIVERFWQL